MRSFVCVVLAAFGWVTFAAAAPARPVPVRPAAKKAAREPLEFTYLGVAGWIISGAGRTVITDPYLTRPADVDKPSVSDPAAVAAHTPAKADLVLVGHSHIDHLLDAPAVAIRTGAELIGSRTTTALAKAAGAPADKLITIGGGEDFEFNGLSVLALKSLHSALGHKHTQHHELEGPARWPLAMDDFPEGGTYAYLVRLAGHEVLVFDTANFIEREVQGLRPDIAIVAPGLRGEIHDYTCRLLNAIGRPKTVVLTHFDEWKKPAQGQDIDDDPEFRAEVERCAPGTKLIVPKVFAPFTLR
ncbi:MAG: MBL fold metallo-hydrolase [Deltaproteobacteria bacterium]|nr:MBL fold metallo-hydrolase [Deltaproteobacteria bacterium]